MLIMQPRKVVRTYLDRCKKILRLTNEAMMYGFTRSLKNEIVKIAPKGRVNCIAPGWTGAVRRTYFGLKSNRLKSRFPADGRSSLERSNCLP